MPYALSLHVIYLKSGRDCHSPGGNESIKYLEWAGMIFSGKNGPIDYKQLVGNLPSRCGYL
jgi:hypothetical protein